MISKQDLEDQREQIQEDLLTILDESEDDQDMLDRVCKVIVDHMKILIEKV